jgi:hypothetical protein
MHRFPMRDVSFLRAINWPGCSVRMDRIRAAGSAFAPSEFTVVDHHPGLPPTTEGSIV